MQIGRINSLRGQLIGFTSCPESCKSEWSLSI